MTELTDRLRNAGDTGKTRLSEQYEAADEIDRLRARLGECTGALQCAGQPIEWQAEIDRLRNNADNLRQQTEDQAAQIYHLRRELADMAVERDILRRDNSNMRASVHTCGPTCSMAGCVNARLREALRGVLRWMPVYPAAADGIVGGRQAHEDAIKAARAALVEA